MYCKSSIKPPGASLTSDTSEGGLTGREGYLQYLLREEGLIREGLYKESGEGGEIELFTVCNIPICTRYGPKHEMSPVHVFRKHYLK